MGPSPAKPGAEKSSGSPDQVYYGVYIPPDIQPSPEDTEHSVVFTDKSEALKLVKKYKKARFKAFRTMNDAMQFAVFGLEVLSVCPLSPCATDVGEKPSPFRGPKPQDMVRFRKAIEGGDFEFVKKTVWENPRYLVSSGDTPAILQEGSRYNALHIAAKVGDSAVCAFVLQTVGSTEFMQHFYGDGVDVEERCSVLLDLYLNTPDKAMNETPLHFASKFGQARVVQVLVTYAQCDTSARNKFQQTAKDVICSRMAGADSNRKEEIATMLEEQFYVPVLRSPDHSIEPVVGQPFSPSSPLKCVEQRTDVTSPKLEVQALAGPMPKQTAELFRRRWKTPPRNSASPIIRRPILIDQDKGWEKVGRELAQEWKVPWKEYWPFLDSYIDLNSPEGLQKLEDYLRKRFKNASEGLDCSTVDAPDSSSSLITPPRQVNGIRSPESPMTELCSALRSCKLSSGGAGGGKPAPRHPPSHRPSQQNGHVRHEEAFPSHVGITTPHLYMEKSCQVFAKRIADGFLLYEGELELLRLEIKHLNILVSSCKSDNRFSQLDFQRLHSRLGQAVAQRLDPSDLPRIKDSLLSFINRKEEVCSSDEEECDMSVLARLRRHLGRGDQQQTTTHSEAVCLARAILSALQQDLANPSNLVLDTEQACVDVWTQAASCDCAFLHLIRTRRKYSQKRLNFKDCEQDEKDTLKSMSSDILLGLNSCTVAPADSSGEESDTSDTSESEFFTPPSSPGLRSDEDQAMESPDEGPDVYITGNEPNKLDISVMEAIKGSELSKANFPNICRWRHIVLLHSETERQSWLSSPKHKSTTGTPPLWHRAPSLSRD